MNIRIKKKQNKFLKKIGIEMHKVLNEDGDTCDGCGNEIITKYPHGIKNKLYCNICWIKKTNNGAV